MLLLLFSLLSHYIFKVFSETNMNIKSTFLQKNKKCLHVSHFLYVCD